MQQFKGLSELSKDALLTIDGGGFWDDVVYAVNITLMYLREIPKAASEFQASLPPSLKK